MKQSVQDELGIWWTPTPEDMLTLTCLESPESNISNITGLEYAHNLQILDLRRNSIGDLSPISGLTQLTSLNLSDTEMRWLGACA